MKYPHSLGRPSRTPWPWTACCSNQELGVAQHHVRGDVVELWLVEPVVQEEGFGIFCAFTASRDGAGVRRGSAKNIAKPISSGNALRRHEEAPERRVRDTRAGGDGLDVCGDVEERSLDAEKCRVRDVELGLVSLDEEVVRRLERGQVLGRLGRISGVNQNPVAVACGR